MNNPTHASLITAGMLVLGAWVAFDISGDAADKKAGVIGDIKELSDAIRDRNDATVKKLAKAIAAKYNADQVMSLFKPRKRNGLGVGATAKAIVPDGIELKLLDLAKKQVNKGQLAKHGPALSQMGYNIAAIATVTREMAPDTRVKEWQGWMTNLERAGVALAKAAKAKDSDGVDKAVSKVNATCASCHEVYRKNK